MEAGFTNVRRIVELQQVPFDTFGCWNSVTATHTLALSCHLVQLPCLSFMICRSNIVSILVWLLFCLDARLAAVYLLTSHQSALPDRAVYGQVKGGMWCEWEEETTQGETPGGRGVTEGRRGRWRLTCHPAVRQFLALGFNSANKQTPYEPKVMLITMHSALRCTQTCMSSQSGARQASIPQPHVWASRQKLVSKHVCVWTCHLLLLLNKSFASHRSNLYGNQCWQAVRAWFTASSLRFGQQWITVRLAADHRRFSLTRD